MTPSKTILAAAFGAAFAVPALAEENPAIGHRQAQFQLYAHNLAVLGGMAQGKIDYDAAMAQTAADNLFHITRHDQGRMWPEGTSTADTDATRALPAIWDNLDDFTAKFADLQDASVALRDVAGDGLDTMRPAVGALGDACGACHEDYRQER